MKKNSKFKLIDGVFHLDDAQEILFNLFNSKINFHKLKNFSSHERFGKDDAAAIKRIAELKTEHEKLNMMLTELRLVDHNVMIKAYVDITICKD